MATNKTQDLVIIGSGIAAMSAAIYAARENLQVTIYEKELIGGLTGTISKIENFPGFAGTGAELTKFTQEQAKSFGAKFQYGECSKIKKIKDIFELTIDDEAVHARAVLVATGSERRKLGIPGEDLPGVSYCATCDGPLYKGKDVIVIGGGNSAVQESFYLLKYCKSVTIVNRSPLRADHTLARRAEDEPRLKVAIGYTPLRIDDTKTGELELTCQDNTSFDQDEQSKDFAPTLRTFKAASAFIFVGMSPATRFVPSEVLNVSGCIETDFNFQTSIPGLFSAGDCRQGNVKQSIVAAGEGAAAAINIGKYLQDFKNI